MTQTSAQDRPRPTVGARWRKAGVNAIVLAVSLAVSLVAAELILRHYIKPREVMTRQFLTQLGVTDADQNWLSDPELGWKIRPDATFRHVSPFGEFDTPVRTDALGLRIALDGPSETARAERTILFVGDSGAAAYEVPHEETYVARVEAILKGTGESVGTLNAGVRGYSTDQSLKRMKALLDRPELAITDVVYEYALNDPFENMSMHAPVRLMSKPGAFLDAEGRLQFRMPDRPLGVLDPEALFVLEHGALGVLPVVGRRSLPDWALEISLRYKEAANWFEGLYLVALVRMTFGMYAAPRELDTVKRRYPDLQVAYYENQAFGGYIPSGADVVWQPGNYPLRLLEEIIRTMKAEADRRGVRFWMSLPLTLGPWSLPVLKDIAGRNGIALIDPVSDGYRDRWATQCGGAVAFRLDTHYNACGHAGHAAFVAAALRQPPGRATGP